MKLTISSSVGSRALSGHPTEVLPHIINSPALSFRHLIVFCLSIYRFPLPQQNHLSHKPETFAAFTSFHLPKKSFL